jgi:hypothetical protein
MSAIKKYLAALLLMAAIQQVSVAWSQDVIQASDLAEKQAKVRDIAPGTQVRVKTLPSRGFREGELISGNFKSCQAGVMTLVISVIPEQTYQVPISELASVEVKTGGSNYTVLGLFAGLALGGLVASTIETEEIEREWLDFSPHIDPKVAGVVTVGAILGPIIGAKASSASWATVFDESMGLSLRVGGKGETEIALGFSF